MKNLLAILALMWGMGTTGVILSGCERDEGAFEEMGEEMDEAGDELEDAVDDAVDDDDPFD